MRIWLAMLIAPTLALACQAVLFALVTPSCAMQSAAALHGVAAASLALAVVFTLLAFGERRRQAASPGRTDDSDSAEPATRRRFLATVASALGAMSCLAIVAMWLTVWVLSPCWQ
jgi:hypothetical protein